MGEPELLLTSFIEANSRATGPVPVESVVNVIGTQVRSLINSMAVGGTNKSTPSRKAEGIPLESARSSLGVENKQTLNLSHEAKTSGAKVDKRNISPC